MNDAIQDTPVLGASTQPNSEQVAVAGRLDELLTALAAPTPTPGAGPAAASTCALAAALVEMAASIALNHDSSAPGSAETAACRERARELRARALELADADVAAYQAVLAARRDRTQPGGQQSWRDALSAAADPPLAIAETAAELAQLAADTARRVRGGVRGEAITAAILAEAATAACLPMLQLNLAGNPGDPRITRARTLTEVARGHRDRATT